MRIFQKIKNIGHFVVAVLANIVFRFPSKELQVIGVTGTDGKTTTSNLIFHILKTNGKKVSIISTISAVIGETESDTGFHVTTPSSFSVQKYIRQAVDYGSKYFVLETTSHALDQYRVFGVRFDVSVITNITQEHLHYHGTYEHYVSSKSKLIHWSNKTFVNKDDQSYSYILKHIGNKKIETYGFNNDADNIIDISKKINIPLAKFNQYNYLAAFLICRELGIAEEDIYPSMKTYKLPPGRLEIVYRGDFIVIVDFAHTPHAVQEALSSIRDEHVTNGRLIHVFGAAAFRDDSKRTPMGRESATYADMVILTEEDYRTEDPYDITSQIAEGLEEHGFKKVDIDTFGSGTNEYTVIIDRQEAIMKACSIARLGDVIVLTGKGHEMSLNRDGKEYHWNDKEEVLKILKDA